MYKTYLKHHIHDYVNRSLTTTPLSGETRGGVWHLELLIAYSQHNLKETTPPTWAQPTANQHCYRILGSWSWGSGQEEGLASVDGCRRPW